MAYTPPSKTAVNFDLSVYTPPTKTSLNFDFSFNVSTAGYIKVYMGAGPGWVLKPVKIYMGSGPGWVIKPLKFYSGGWNLS